jgi:hypothetical protein
MALPGEPRLVPVVKFPLPGVVTIPRHVAASHVEGVTRAALVETFSRITPELIDGVPDGPPADSRRSSRWTMVADATGRDGRSARGVVSGPDTYGATALIAVALPPPDPGRRGMSTRVGCDQLVAPHPSWELLLSDAPDQLQPLVEPHPSHT